MGVDLLSLYLRHCGPKAPAKDGAFLGLQKKLTRECFGECECEWNI